MPQLPVPVPLIRTCRCVSSGQADLGFIVIIKLTQKHGKGKPGGDRLLAPQDTCSKLQYGGPLLQ